MKYKDLPLDQRMELASQYVLLLVADNKPAWVIISIIKKDYALTDEQAAQAVKAMRTNYKAEYNSTVRRNLLIAFGAAGVILVTFFFFYFMGDGLGHASAFLTLWAISFGLGGIVALFVIARIIWDRFSKPTAQKPGITKPARKLDNVDKVLQTAAIMSGIFLCFSGYEYFFRARIVDVTKIVTVNNCVITEPVKYEHTRGKSRSYYYAFKLRGSDLDFRFFDRYYNYSNGEWYVSKLKEGDTVSIQLLNQEAFNYYQYPYNTNKLEIINLGQHGRFLVDHSYRNGRIRKDQVSAFNLFLTVFACVMPLIFFKHLYNNKKHRRQTAR